MEKSARIFLLLSTLAFLFLRASSSASAQNLLENPGFEDGTSGWSVYPSTVTFAPTSSKAKSGNNAGLVTKKSSKGWGYLYQELEVISGAEYKFSGWVYLNDVGIKYVKLRIDWRDAAGERVDLSEVKLEDRSPEFQKLSLTATAPEDAARAKVEAFVNLTASDPSDPVLFDDLVFELVKPLLISFTLPSEVTAGEGFAVPVTVKNAEPLADYYAKAVIGESTASASLRQGYTYNPSLDKWLAGNGAWEKMPTFVTDAEGFASFTLKSKVKDDASSGTYYFLVRIRKVGTDDNLDSDALTFFVNESPDSSDSSDSFTPKISFTVEGESFKVNQPFDVKIEIKNAKPWHDYYVKIRLGLSESKLTKGRTYNSFYGKWLADNAFWSYFPVVYTAPDGSERLTVSAKVASGNLADTYYVGVRIRDKETGKNYDSDLQTIDVGEEEVSKSEEDELEDGGSVLGVVTELPATGANLFRSLTINLFLTTFGLVTKFILRRKYITMVVYFGSILLTKKLYG